MPSHQISLRTRLFWMSRAGAGYGSSYLGRKGAKTVVGGDVSRDAIEYAKAHYTRDGLSFECLDATELPLTAECFDAVVSFETIEHLRDYRKFLSEVKSVLSSGGLFLVSTPNKRAISPFTKRPLTPLFSA